MVIVNIVYQAGLAGTPWTMLAVFILTYAIAFASWRLVEKPALMLKRHALRTYSVKPALTASATPTAYN